MRKILAVAVALILALAAMSALADAAEAPGTSQNFGDFTLTYPDTCSLDLGEKTSDSVYFTLFSTATSGENFANNLNCVWTKEYEDLSQYEPQDLLDFTVSNFASNAAAEGLTVTNVQPLKAEKLLIGGKEALAIGYSYDADYSNLGLNLQASLYCMSVSVSDPALGIYTFSVTSANQEGLMELANVLDTLVWN